MRIYCVHMDVGVRELKARLSTYLARAAAGEVVTVTDRGRPIAVLTAPPGSVDLKAAAAAGWLRPATGGPLRPVRRQQAEASVLDVLRDDRGE